MEATEDVEIIQTAITKESKSCKAGCLKSCCSDTGCDISITMGTLIPVSSKEYDPGTSVSIIVPIKCSLSLPSFLGFLGENLDFQAVNVFGRTWSIGAELNFSSLSGIDGAKDASMIAGIAHFDPSFDLPVDITFGLGIAKSDELLGYSGLVAVDVQYKLPIDKFDTSINLRYLDLIDVKKEGTFLEPGLFNAFDLSLGFDISF